MCRSSTAARSWALSHVSISAVSSWIASTRRPACGSGFGGRRAGSEADHLLRDAAEEEAGEPAMATTPDDDEIRLPVPGCSNDLLGGVTERRLGRDRRR